MILGGFIVRCVSVTTPEMIMDGFSQEEASRILHIRVCGIVLAFFPFYPLQVCLANHLFKEEGIWDKVSLLQCMSLFVAVVLLLYSLLFGQNWRVMILKFISHCPSYQWNSPLFQNVHVDTDAQTQHVIDLGKYLHAVSYIRGWEKKQSRWCDNWIM